MLVSVMVLMSFVSRPAREIASAVGGFGFGTFIDELGKFLTQENNYFFQPAIAIIYLVFALLYIAGKALTKVRRLSQTECLSQVMEIAKHGVHEGLNPQDRERALALLALCESENPTVLNLQVVLSQIDVGAVGEPSFLTKLRALPHYLYQQAVRQPWFIRAVVGLFLLQSVTTLVENVALVRWSLGLAFWFVGLVLVILSLTFFRRGRVSMPAVVLAAGLIGISLLTSWAVVMEVRQGPVTFVNMGTIIFPTISSALVVFGIGLLPHSRLAAYQTFRQALLITILLTQVYAFYEHQLIAITGLFINIVIFLTLRYMINQEQGKASETIRVLAPM